MEDRIFGPHHIQQVWKTYDHLFQYLKEINNWRMALNKAITAEQKWEKYSPQIRSGKKEN